MKKTKKKTKSQGKINFIIIGDMGKGTKEQYQVADSMSKFMKKQKYSFIHGLGDNIYPDGCKDTNDPLFKSNFEKPYKKLPNHIKWYMCLGNHDYGYAPFFASSVLPQGVNQMLFRDNSKSQLDYHTESQKKGGKWVMPSRFYTHTKGPIEFFVLDTNFDRISSDLIKEQRKYIKNAIKKSKKRWKILVGHHTWRSVAEHGSAEFPELEEFLNDLGNNTDIDMYLCGHDHCKSLIMKPLKKRKIPLIVCGTGGERYDYNVYLSKLKDDKSELEYFSPNLGICTMECSRNTLRATFYDEKCREEYSHLFEKS